MENGKIRRRAFVKSAGAALAAPWVITSTALGGEGKPPASERITMGTIGIGGRGRYVMGAFMGNDDVQMIAVCDARRERRQKAKELVDKNYGNQDCATYVDFRELLARDDIDAVLIATGENWHALTSIMAAKAGKDIYSEKPPAHTVPEGRALAETVKRWPRRSNATGRSTSAAHSAAASRGSVSPSISPAAGSSAS